MDHPLLNTHVLENFYTILYRFTGAGFNKRIMSYFFVSIILFSMVAGHLVGIQKVILNWWTLRSHSSGFNASISYFQATFTRHCLQGEITKKETGSVPSEYFFCVLAVPVITLWRD